MGAVLADMQLLSKCNKRFQFLSSVIDIFRIYAWVVPLKDKEGVATTNAFQKILDAFWHKSNKIWVHKGSEFYSKSMKSLLRENDVEMYSAYN